MTIFETLDSFLQGKRRRQLRSNSKQQLGSRLKRFCQFCINANAKTMAGISREMLERYQVSLELMKDLSQKQHLAAVNYFLRSSGRGDLLGVLVYPRASQQDKSRRAPQPFSDEDVKKFLAVADARTALLFRLQLETGLSIVDALQLSPENIVEKCIRIRRQKTGRVALVPVSELLEHDIRLNCPLYHGKNIRTGVATWSTQLRSFQRRAGIYRRGNLSHRCRDTFVDRAISRGHDLTLIAGMIGDRVTTLESHYADMLSVRQAQRIRALVQPISA